MNLPPYDDIKIRETQDGKLEVLDILRHRFVSLTPEEWVRQHFVNFLISHKGYPAALMANEVELRVGGKHLRVDTILYDRERRPLMVIEYKAESVALTKKVVTQVTTYNMLLRVHYLIISNGSQHVCLRYDAAQNLWQVLADIPHYDEVR
ncbi:MAG: type I restriction enzyme HsdR N-terminal domain-containing protein, partial [Prevotella sp.]|jgi:predicted type IV restriction endonuclease|nr:type I restriction enzyme HsdR N-terminal domain-containing protein [Prevotella sp.]MBR2204034.1 type I restriction enzyme HsdR N-terminal domain-containing protein [Prevotella sp.]